ncbi:MAG: hypothetical protein GX610_15365 [Rhodococcus sp.]|nr:hypothetical protein [Rhodococcus sp. (in: high G+C Gram-positive bacteria)]
MDATPDGTFHNAGAAVPSLAVIDLKRDPEAGSGESHSEVGAARAPHTDMFDGWLVTHHAFSTGTFDDKLACVDKFPDPPELRPVD